MRRYRGPGISDELMNDLMAIEERIRVAPTRVRARVDGCGHIYVIGFSSGVMKVGKTAHPKVRLASHRQRARVHGDRIAQSWTSPMHPGYDGTERRLIAFCRDLGTRLSAEYFADLDYETVRYFAHRLADDAGREAYLRSLIDAAGGDLSVSWADAQSRLAGAPA